MMQFKLIRAAGFGQKELFTEYLELEVIGHEDLSSESCGPKLNRHFTSVKPSVELPPLSPELRERLLGKAPLRIVAERTKTYPGVWTEILECGHAVATYADFHWDEKSHLVNLEPSAKRRRCQECKTLALSLPPKKPVVSASPRKKAA